MSTKIKLLLFFVLISFCANAQVKIGENPNSIDSASIVELESTDKAFVLTRLTNIQMQAITPLNGAVIYNTDTQCVHYFNGTIWTNLCDGNASSSFSFTDNGDGTITLLDGDGNDITFNINDDDTDSQNEIQSLDYTAGVLTLSNDPSATIIDFSGFDQNAADDFSGSYNDLTDIPANLDIDATDDFNTGISFDGTNLTVSDAGGDVTTDISGLAYDDTAIRADIDQNELDADNAIAAVDTKIEGHILADEDTSATNELSDLSLDATSNILTLTNAEAGATGVNLSGYVSTDDQNLESATLSAASELGINIEGGDDVTVDLSALEESADITAVDNKVDAHILADEDISATNELSDLNLDASNILTLTNPATGTNEVDLSGFVSTDDQNLESATLSSASELGINIEGGNDVTVDLSALEESDDITAVQDDVDQNELDADNAIAAVDTKIDDHILADEDTSATNELSDLNLDATSNILTLTNAEAGATGVDLSGFVSSDDQNLESATLSGTSELAINIEGGDDVTVDLSALEESADITAVQDDVDQNELDADNAIAAVDTKIDNHILADEDISATNELSDLSLDATSNILTLTNAEAGATGVNLSGYVSTDDQNLESATLSAASELGINIEGGDDVTVDLSALEESADITAVDNKVDAHILADEDISATNELSDLNLDASNILTLTNPATGTNEVDLSGFVSTDDQNLESATLSSASELGINIEGGNDVTVDLSALEESADITAVQDDVDQNELDVDNAIAAVDTKIDDHILADEDISATNELSDLNLDASNILTLTNPATGTNEVDLSGFVSSDDQNLESATLSGTSELAINIEGGDDVTVDLSALEESADITAVDTKIDNHILADEDTSATNELSDLSLDASNILTLTNPATGTNEVDLSGFVSTDDQNLESATLSSASELGINIEGGNDVTVDLSALEESADITAVDTKIDDHILADEDTSATNELSDLSLDASNILTLTNPATGTNEVDLSGFVSTDDQNLESATLSSASELGINIEGGNDVTVDLSALEESADITAVQDDVDQNELDADNAIAAVDTKIDDHILADEDTSATNELSDLSLDATSNILTLTNAEAGATGVNLSGYVSTDDQNLESATLSAASELGINIEGGNDVTVDLSALEESADITEVQDDVDQNELDADNAIAAVDTKIDDHILADEDISATNELSDLNLDASNILTLTNPATGTNEVDLSGFVSTDDQNLESATLSNASELGINIEGGNDVTVDLSALEESADITAVQDDVDQNEIDADNAIAAVDTKIDDHILADGDISATNELSDLNLDATSNILTLTNAEAGATGVDLSGFVSTDDQNLESATLSAASELGINIEGGNDVTVDLSALEESADITAVQDDVDQNELDADNAIAAVDTKIDDHILADEDISATNELSDLSLDATSNILTLTNAEAGATGVNLSGYVSTDDQNLESATLSAASELGINIEGGDDVTVDLSALEESADITAVDNKVDAHILADEDISATNELSDLNLDASNILTLTNPATGTNEVDLSGFVSTDDQNLESATLSNASELGINIEGGNDVTVDLSALEESADITAVQDDVDQNELDADNAIAAVDTKIDDHILADEDTSATNELSDLNLDASNILTLTNPATGTNEVDLSGFVSTDDQNLESATLSNASELGINIEGGNDVTVDLSALEESADITAVDNKVDAHIIADEDTSSINELSDLNLDASNILTLTNPATGTNEVDLSGFVSTDDQNLESATLSSASELGINIEGGNDVTVDLSALEESADITAVDTKIDDHILADEDTSATNELSDLSLDASNILTLTNPATGTNEVDLSGFVSTDDQNLESATLSSASELGINIEGGDDVIVDLSALEESADITAVDNKVDAHILADEDISATNELSDLNLDASNILTLTNPATGTNEVDLSGFVSTDDQNLESATLSSASELGINIEGGNDVTVDLSALEESADITAVQNDVDQNELDADNAIAAVDTKIDDHILADEDISATNELSDLNLDASNILTLTNPATGTNEVDLSGFVSTDDQNLESATLSNASELGINIEGGDDVTVDLSALEESDDITAVQDDVDQNELDADNAIAAVDTKIDDHILADEDISATNELSDLSLDATSNILTLTNAEAGATGVNLSGFVSTDDQNLESATLSNASELGINIEGGDDVTVDLSALEESAD
ncbi:hypothetical protein PXD56_15875, partial [Maribacter sp. SA7]